MLSSKLARPMVGAAVACAITMGLNGVVFADDAQTQALKDQMRIMQQQMQQLQQQLDALSQKQQQQQAGPPPSAATAPEGKTNAVTPGEEVRHLPEGLLRIPGCVGGLHHQGHLRHSRVSLELRDRRSGQRLCAWGAEGGAVRQRGLARGHVEQRLEHRLPRFA